MQLGLKYRLFLVLLAATGMVALGMTLIMQWSLDRGFLQYVNTLEQERLERLGAVLERHYAGQGGWESLRRDRRGRLGLMTEAFPEHRERYRHPEEPPHPPGAPPPPPRPISRFERRLLLVDAERRPVFGPSAQGEGIAWMPLDLEGETIGYLGLLPRRHLSELNQLRFLRQQKLAFALVAALMLAVSALLAWPLARRLVRPIQALAGGARRLAAGEYATRVPATRGDELGRLAADFNALAAALERTETDRRRWVADISHELRTPLAVLRGEIEALQDGVRPLSGGALESLHGEVLQLSRLVDDLYQLSLSDLGALSYRKEPLDLAEPARQALEALRPRFEQKGIDLKAEVPGPGKALLLGDRDRLTQLFTNLLGNSLHYTDAGGRAQLSLTCTERGITVTLEDSAPGVPEAELPKLFERLYRVEGSRSRASGGAGLGLSICRSIVEAHGGTIGAGPSSFGGLRITVDLPREKERR